MTSSPARNFSFKVEKRSGKARTGTLTTAHGTIRTPVFMPVATNAAVRGQDSATLSGIGFGMILANTYHLLLRPGADIFRKYGGIHPFMRWPSGVLTDSGGYQIFSLSRQLKMSEEGAEFRSYIDGQKILLTPELSIATQGAIGSDIMMVLDQCVASTSDKETTRTAMHLTHRWAKRSYAARGDSPQALFGIVQGGCFHDLRLESASQITSIPFDGYAIGGVAVGEDRTIRDEIVAYTAQLLSEHTPRYLMGVGTPVDILEAVASGMDMFDCIIPTAMAEQGVCFTSLGRLRLERGVYAELERPLDEKCRCSTCLRFSRGYLHHLLKAGEHLAATLIGVHNLTFYHDLMSQIRDAIDGDSFTPLYKEKRDVLGQSDPEFPVRSPKMRSARKPTGRGDYEIHRIGGTTWIKQRSSGEIMHSVTEPAVEAERLYVGPSRLRDLAREHSSLPIVIWDVGLGAASNAMAAIQAYESETERDASAARPCHLWSFENDLDPLKLSLSNRALFPHLQHPAPHALAARGEWHSKRCNLHWKLLFGNFLEQCSLAETPTIIFFDPFSYKTNSELWGLKTFSAIMNRVRDTECALFTYSASTSVRAALLASGFFLAKGAGSGPKGETTIALTPLAATSGRYELLGKEWIHRWQRSQNRYPLDLKPEDETMLADTILGHPQFKDA